MEELDLKTPIWELSHLKLSLSWSRVWKNSMEPIDIGNNNNMNIQDVEEIDHFREDFDRSEEKMKTLIKVGGSDALDRLARRFVTYDDIISYPKRSDANGEDEIFWKSCETTGHSAVKKKDNNYMNHIMNPKIKPVHFHL